MLKPLMIQDFESIDFSESVCDVNTTWMFLWIKYQLNFSRLQIKKHFKRVKAKFKMLKTEKQISKKLKIPVKLEQTSSILQSYLNLDNKKQKREESEIKVKLTIGDYEEQKKVLDEYIKFQA